MSEISAQLVKELRERSGVGMSKCKEALVEANGDISVAADILRKKGLASAVKKEGRETKEGTISFFETNDIIALTEVNTETDFVAKNEKFQKFVAELTEQVAESKASSLQDFLKQSYNIDPSLTIDEYRNLLVQSIGENIQISKIGLIHKKPKCSYGIYSHMKGKIVTIVEISGSSDEEKFARELAMHVAAENPQYLKASDIPKAVLRKEEEIARSQIKGKPENVIEKIVEGKIRSFEDQVCFVLQKYIKDPSNSVEKIVSQKSKDINAQLTVSAFWRWAIGESA